MIRLRRHAPEAAPSIQSRPEGFHLEHIPATETSPAGPTAGIDKPDEIEFDDDLARIQGELASLRQILTVVVREKAELLDENQLLRRAFAGHNPAAALELITTLHAQLASACRTLEAHRASEPLLITLRPIPLPEMLALLEQPVT